MNEWKGANGPRPFGKGLAGSEWVKSLSRVRLFVTPWTIAYKAPLSMEFSRQEYWSGCHYLLQGIFPTQGLKLSLSPALAGGFFTSCATWKLGGVSPHLSWNYLLSYCYGSSNPCIIWNSEPTLWNTILRGNDLALLGWYKGRGWYKFWK